MIYITEDRDGVIQGDIISSVLFILVIDQIMQKYDQGGLGLGGKGKECGRILRLKVLGYADDAALSDRRRRRDVETMTNRLTKIGDASRVTPARGHENQCQ